MDYCRDGHDHKYLITYKGTRSSSRIPRWTVCEYCYNNKEIFNDPEQVESIAILV